jgi:hypothetical protein
MHIDGDQFNINSKPAKWKEVSVGGSVFDLGEGRLKFNYQTPVNILLPPSPQMNENIIDLFSHLLIQIIF